MWPIEPIPDEDSLFYRIHKNFYPNKELKPRVFAPRGEGMSTDWEEYSTPEESRNRAKIPEDNGIVSFITRDLRNLPLDVIHAPIGNDPNIPNNRAHTNVKGTFDEEIRLKINVFISMGNLSS